MSRAPFVVGKAEKAFTRKATLEDTTIGWRFINELMRDMYGTHSMPETAENVAFDFNVSRSDQDAFALRSQQRTAEALASGRLNKEIVAVHVSLKSGDEMIVERDEHPRPETTEADLSKLKGVVRTGGSVTAGNASGINDGACALLIASEDAVAKNNLSPRARIVGMATAGVEPRIMGMGPVPATLKVLQLAGLTLSDMDVIELNEAFASQAIAVLRELGVSPDAQHVNPNGGAIALGHPLGMSGARLITTALHQLEHIGGRYALCTMCIGVGQGIAVIIERICNE